MIIVAVMAAVTFFCLVFTFHHTLTDSSMISLRFKTSDKTVLCLLSLWPLPSVWFAASCQLSMILCQVTWALHMLPCCRARLANLVAMMVARLVAMIVTMRIAKMVTKMVARLVASASAENITKLQVKSTRALNKLSAHSRLSQNLFPRPGNILLLSRSWCLGSLSPLLLGRSLLVWESL